MTAPHHARTSPTVAFPLPKAQTVTGWLLVAAALIVNVAVHRGHTTEPWVWCLAATVLLCASVQRRGHHRRRHHRRGTQ